MKSNALLYATNKQLKLKIKENAILKAPKIEFLSTNSNKICRHYT